MDSKVTISNPNRPADCGAEREPSSPELSSPEPMTDLMVSLQTEVPEALLLSMRVFIEQHPNWDQYRLFQAALAGFLVQNGIQSRDVTRCYLANLFPAQGRFRCG